MKKSEINLEELLKDAQKVFNIIDEIEEKDINKINTDKMEKVLQKLQKDLKEKYPDNLDTKK